MNIKPIRTKEDYKAALKTIDSLMSAKANTSEGDRLDVLLTLIEAYERTHFLWIYPMGMAPFDCASASGI
jgi:HTH-type transcriptional regulator/antitoxin HigA